MGKPYPKDRDRKPVKVIKVKMVGPKARSVKKRKLDAERAIIREQLKRERGDWCEIAVKGCLNQPVYLHEKLKGKEGGSMTDPSNLVLACNHCNGWVEDNPKKALELGFRESRQVQNV